MSTFVKVTSYLETALEKGLWREQGEIKKIFL